VGVRVKLPTPLKVALSPSPRPSPARGEGELSRPPVAGQKTRKPPTIHWRLSLFRTRRVLLLVRHRSYDWFGLMLICAKRLVFVVIGANALFLDGCAASCSFVLVFFDVHLDLLLLKAQSMKLQSIQQLLSQYIHTVLKRTSSRYVVLKCRAYSQKTKTVFLSCHI